MAAFDYLNLVNIFFGQKIFVSLKSEQTSLYVYIFFFSQISSFGFSNYDHESRGSLLLLSTKIYFIEHSCLLKIWIKKKFLSA